MNCVPMLTAENLTTMMIEHESLWQKFRRYARASTLGATIGTSLVASLTSCSSYEPKIKYWSEETCIHDRIESDCPECRKAHERKH